MTPLDLSNNSIGSKRQRIHPLRALIYGIIAVTALVVAGVYLIDRTGTGAVSPDDIKFDAGAGTQVSNCGNKLVTLSSRRFAFYNSNGTSETFSRSVSMDEPTLKTCESKAIAFDRGGSLFVTDGKSVLLTIDEPVYTAKPNARGWFVVVTQQSGYRSVAGVYNKKNQLVFQYKYASRFIMDAALSPNGSHMAILSAGQDGAELKTTLSLHDTSKEEPTATVEINSGLGLSVFYPSSGRVCVLTETDVRFYNSDGELLSVSSFGDELLLDFAAGDDFFLLRTGPHRSGLHSRLQILRYDGTPVTTLSFTENFSALSASGKYFSVLSNGHVTIYNEKGESKRVLEGLADVRDIRQQPDGKILLIGNETARFA